MVKKYTLTSGLEGEGGVQGLDVGSKSRIEFSICELPLMFKYNLQNADWQDILKQQTPDRAYDLSLNDILTSGISNHWEQNQANIPSKGLS